MKVYELTLKGFDGGTDETDNKIIWIASNHHLKLIDNKSNPIASITEIQWDKNDVGIDLVIE